MKLILSTCLMALLLCVQNAQAQKEINQSPIPPFLLGDIEQSDLTTGSYNQWFEGQYTNYTPKAEVLQELRTTLEDKEFILFLGTWCGDSKREVPRMLRILKEAGVAESRIRIIALDRRPGKYKTSPEGLEKKYYIKRVPTLIILSQGQEINRIVERPWRSLEEDLLVITQDQSYLPRYSR